MASSVEARTLRTFTALEQVTFKQEAKIAAKTAEATALGIHALLLLSSERERVVTKNELNKAGLTAIPVKSLAEIEKSAKNALTQASKIQNDTVLPHRTTLNANAVLPTSDPSFCDNQHVLNLFKYMGDRIATRYDDLRISLDGDASILATAKAFGSLLLGATNALTTAAASALNLVSMSKSSVVGDDSISAEQAQAAEPPIIQEVLSIDAVGDSKVHIGNMLAARQEDLRSYVPDAFANLSRLNQAYELFKMLNVLESSGVDTVTVKSANGDKTTLDLNSFYKMAKATHTAAEIFFDKNAKMILKQLQETIGQFKLAAALQITPQSDPTLKQTHDFATHQRIAFLEAAEKMCQVFMQRFADRDIKILPYIERWDKEHGKKK